MASIKSRETGSLVRLYFRHLIGRSSLADLVVDDRLCSSRHCEVRWRDNAWCVHDLNSRNGTWLDGHRVAPESAEVLVAGRPLAFGNPALPWDIIDIGPPTAVLISPEGTPFFAEDGVLVVPTASASERLVIHETNEGNWQIESPDGTTMPAPAERRINVADQPWRLLCPVVQPDTERFVPRREFDALTLRFHLTTDGRNCRIEAVIDGAVLPIEPRAHDRLILHLARARLANPAAGWVHRDDLWGSMRLDESELNVWIYRIRRHFNALGISGSGRLIERQQGEGLIRLGVPQIEFLGAD